MLNMVQLGIHAQGNFLPTDCARRIIPVHGFFKFGGKAPLQIICFAISDSFLKARVPNVKNILDARVVPRGGFCLLNPVRKINYIVPAQPIITKTLEVN